MPTPGQRNAKIRVEEALEEGKLPAAKDIKTLEGLSLPESDNLLDRVDSLKAQRSSLAQSLKSTEASPRIVEPKLSLPTDREVPSHSDVGEKKPQQKRLNPREKDYYEFFNNRFGPLIVLLLYLLMADLEKAVFYAPSPDECHELAPHLARLGPKVEDWFRLPKWAHDVVVTSDDTFTIGMVLVGYLDRIGVLEKLVPWFTGAASKVKKLNDQPKSQGGATEVQPTNGAEGRMAGAGDRNFVPLNQLGVVGLGEQYSPV